MEYNTSITMTSNDTSNPPSNPNESNPGETPDMDNPKIYVLSSIILLTLLGNGYVFFSIVSRARKTAYSYNGKMTRMYYFMLHLSSADILTALLTLLSELIWTFTSPHFYGGNLVCKAVKFLQMIGPYLSPFLTQIGLLRHFDNTVFVFVDHNIILRSQSFHEIDLDSDAWTTLLAEVSNNST
ncbi:vasopressin V2 receptor-like [Tigriopus californicus]|uniref:vasopressin V2 receptor-like n=1 Tax=Tigriopus californicus TaxID=6832 RepID=UPI0027DA9555|nr:vasopressin V2 receptor-like [Tigriopus californicus]